MKKFFQITSLLLLLVSLIGCPKDPVVKDQTGSLQGRVIFDNENVTDFSNIYVTLNSKADKNITWDYTTDETGNFEFKDIPVGNYTVSAMSNASGNKRAVTNVEIISKQTVTIKDDLKLIAVGSISGKITIDKSANDVFGLDVFIAGKSYNAKVAEDGSYEISDIPAKKGYVLCVQKGDKSIVIKRDLEVKKEEVTPLDYDVKSEDLINNINVLNHRGELDKAPENPKLYDIYYNTTDGCSYICFDGKTWTLLASAGAKGDTGATGATGEKGDKGDKGDTGAPGKDGVSSSSGNSISWKGEFDKAPESPKLYDVYYNKTDGCSYIYNGKTWDLLAHAGAAGKDGTNGTDGKDGVDGTDGEKGDKGDAGVPGKDGEKGDKGDTGAPGKDGSDGIDGISIIWKGVYVSAPEDPELNWAYFNLMDGSSYIWNGYKWDYLAKGGKQECIHEFTSWEEKEATEFVEGYRKTNCTKCEIAYKEIIPRLPIPVVNPEPYGTRVDNLNHIFNNQTLGTTTITLKRSEWNKLCDNYRYFYKNENCVHAEKYEYTKDGETWEIPNVGFRQRGNTSRFCPQGVDNGRLQGQANADWSADYYAYAEEPNNDYRQVHFKVDFEEFLEGDEELKMAGCMKGVALKRMDHSWGREIFCYDLFHKYGIWTAPRASHTRVILKFIEDETDNSITTVDYGVYEMFEEVNKQSLKARAQGEGETASNLWANNKGNLWKCASPSDLTEGNTSLTGVEDIRIIFECI